MKKIIILVVMVAAFVLPTMAQSAQEWQTASLPGSGSNYAPQVTAVGASVAASEATTTTESYSPAGNPGAIRRGFDTGGETGRSDESPVGDAVLPLLALAMVYGVWCMVYRRKRRA
jgi:hypothetical protein